MKGKYVRDRLERGGGVGDDQPSHDTIPGAPINARTEGPSLQDDAGASSPTLHGGVALPQWAE